MTEDRKRYGLILEQTILDNMTLAGLRSISGRFLSNRSKETMAARGPMNALRIKANSLMTITGTLSGGNQQKVVLGKWLLTIRKCCFWTSRRGESTSWGQTGVSMPRSTNWRRTGWRSCWFIRTAGVLGLSDRKSCCMKVNVW